MRFSPGSALVAALLVAIGCRGEHGSSSSAPTPTERASSAPAPSVEVAEAPGCHHRRPFGDSDKPLILPAPFNGFTPCDVVKALRARDPAAKGPVRIDRVRRWATGDRKLLAALYYRGEDAEPQTLCDKCRVTVHLALVEIRDGSVVPAAAAPDPTPLGPDVHALYGGRADFDAEVPFDGTETLLAVKTPWSSGAPGTQTNLALYRLLGDTLRIVFEQNVDWLASGKGLGDDDEVASALVTAPRAGGFNDLVLTTTEVRCHLDEGSYEPVPICGQAQPLGTERWRFDDAAYQRVEGKPAPLPRLLHERWGW